MVVSRKVSIFATAINLMAIKLTTVKLTMVKLVNKTCLVAEIKRNKDRISLQDLEEKMLALTSEFSSYQIRMQGLSLEEV